MIKFDTRLLIILTLLISSCSSLEALKQSYKKNLSAPLMDESYVVQPGDSIWSISINLNLDADVLIKNNNLKKPYIIYPKQKLALSGNFSKIHSTQMSQAISWHHPLGEGSKVAIKFPFSLALSKNSSIFGSFAISGKTPSFIDLIFQ